MKVDLEERYLHAREMRALISRMKTKSLSTGLKRMSLRSGQKVVSRGSKMTQDNEPEKKSAMENLAPELLFMIFSYLGISELFPLKMAGSHYLSSAIRNFQLPLPSLETYLSDLKANMPSPKLPGTSSRDDIPHYIWEKAFDSNWWNQDDKRVGLNLAAIRGQDGLIIAIMNIYKKSKLMQWEDRHSNRSAMSFAAEFGHLHTVKLLLKLEERKLWYRDKNGLSIMDYAAGSGQTAVVQFLLSKGCKASSSIKERQREIKKSRHAERRMNESNGATPLVWAVRGEHIEMVKFLIDAGATHDLQREVYKGYRSESPLEEALSCGNMDIVQILMNAGSLLDADMLVTPLQISIKAGRIEMVEWLCKNGAPLDRTLFYIDPPLHQACKLGNTEIVRILLDHGASMEQLSEVNQCTALWKATDGDHIDIVRYLISRGADPRKDGTPHSTPLDHATASGFYEMMKLLIAHGDNIAPADPKISPLHTAIRLRSIRRLDVLLKGGAIRVNVGDDAESWREGLGRALVYAASKGIDTAVELLLKYGPVLNWQDSNKCTALHYAASGWYVTSMHILELLLANGASTELKDRQGWTPVISAAYARKNAAVVALLNAGADSYVSDNVGRTIEQLLNRPVTPEIEYSGGIGGGCG